MIPSKAVELETERKERRRRRRGQIEWTPVMLVYTQTTPPGNYQEIKKKTTLKACWLNEVEENLNEGEEKGEGEIRSKMCTYPSSGSVQVMWTHALSHSCSLHKAPLNAASGELRNGKPL